MNLLDAKAFMEPNRFDSVKDELTAGTGDLVDWARVLPGNFWIADSAGWLAAMTELAAWAANPVRLCRQDAVYGFLGSADLRLNAHAMATVATLVTREQPAPESKTTIKISDICTAFGVVRTDPFSTYRSLGL